MTLQQIGDGSGGKIVMWGGGGGGGERMRDVVMVTHQFMEQPGVKGTEDGKLGQFVIMDK